MTRGIQFRLLASAAIQRLFAVVTIAIELVVLPVAPGRDVFGTHDAHHRLASRANGSHRSGLAGCTNRRDDGHFDDGFDVAETVAVAVAVIPVVPAPVVTAVVTAGPGIAA